MKNSVSIFSILQSVCKGVQNRSEVNYLIETTYSYACSYLKHRYKTFGNLLLAEDLKLQELAIDAIAQLFQRDEKGNFISIIKTYNKWEPKISSEEGAAFFINQLAAKCVEKYLSEMLRQSDPFFSKVLDSVNYLIEKQNYKKKRFIGTVFIVENDKISPCGLLAENQFIYGLASSFFYSKNDLLPALFKHIKETTEYLPAIPLNALVIKIKHVNIDAFVSSKSTFSGEGTEVESLMNKALNTIFMKMNKSYVEKNKIDDIEAAKIRDAFRVIAADLQDGGINTGLHKYFLDQFTNLTFEDYQQRYQNIFEYLFKLFKDVISEQLID